MNDGIDASRGRHEPPHTRKDRRVVVVTSECAFDADMHHIHGALSHRLRGAPQCSTYPKKSPRSGCGIEVFSETRVEGGATR